MKHLCLALAAVLLAGCGGGTDTASAMSMPDQSPVPPPGDTFTSALIVLVRSAPDTTEPADVDGAAPVAHDGGEPVAVE
ncbi:hypothetical protein SAMN05518865_101425 [Duganella sp. CF458]|uniref:hypothetical protein n=1 Tax=Duganella sp. CF458 TaxID=1884368 RepID=UPI0008E25592|nr:hypothetical protein [Duganella sp. CF458]SFF55024.1 hypothetical protein SAMN05518865_101425 [Duganella sp. CF458]